MTGSRGTSPETRKNENKTPLHAKQDHSEQALLAQNIVSNRSTTVTNFWFESLIPSESPYFNKQHSIKAIHVHSQLHRPLREDSPIKSDHSREDREIIEFKHLRTLPFIFYRPRRRTARHRRNHRRNRRRNRRERWYPEARRPLQRVLWN